MPTTATPVHDLCLRTLACQPTHRVPRYLPAIACDVASEILGRKAHTGTGSLHYAEALALSRGPQAHAEFVDRMRQDVRAIHEALGIDVYREPWRFRAQRVRQIDEFTFLVGDPEGDHSLWRYEPSSADFSVVQQTFGQTLSPEDQLRQTVATLEGQRGEAERRIRAAIDAHAATCRRLGERFFPVFAGGSISVGLDVEDLIALASEPQLMARKLVLQAQDAIAIGRALLDAGCPAVMLAGADMASNDGPIYSPASFRGVVLPAYQLALATLNELGAHYVFRSDGNLWPVADMLFGDARCPGYGEADRDAGMTLGRIRQRYPRLVVWGNVSSRFLTEATAKQVREECRRIIGESGGVGYFHACSNAIVKGTPGSNVEAMYGAA